MLAKEKEEQDEYVAAIELLKEMYQKTLRSTILPFKGRHLSRHI